MLFIYRLSRHWRWSQPQHSSEWGSEPSSRLSLRSIRTCRIFGLDFPRDLIGPAAGGKSLPAHPHRFPAALYQEAAPAGIPLFLVILAGHGALADD